MRIKDRRALIIFVRRPELGKVKTRLAAEVGKDEALRIYIRLLDHTREVAQSVDCSRHLWYADKIETDDMWPPISFDKYKQPDSDLGGRMKAAFAQALENHDKVVIIGSDCPKLSTDIVEEAYDALDDHDLVIGPTYDGGYYLLGMKNLHTFLFDDMRWSVDDVCETTISRSQDHNLSSTKLTKLSDVDYKSDWEEHGLD